MIHSIVTFFHPYINYFANQPTSFYTTIFSYLGGSTLVASILQVVKNKKNFARDEAEAKKLVIALLGFLSFLAAAADWYLQTNATNPFPTIGHSTAYILTGAIFIHRIAVSPIYVKLVERAAKLVEDAHAYRATIAPLPLSPAEAPAPAEQTFSE